MLASKLINPFEGLKHSLAQIMGVIAQGLKAHQPIRGIETKNAPMLPMAIYGGLKAHQPIRGIETIRTTC